MEKKNFFVSQLSWLAYWPQFKAFDFLQSQIMANKYIPSISSLQFDDLMPWTKEKRIVGKNAFQQKKKKHY